MGPQAGCRSMGGPWGKLQVPCQSVETLLREDPGVPCRFALCSDLHHFPGRIWLPPEDHNEFLIFSEDHRDLYLPVNKAALSCLCPNNLPKYYLWVPFVEVRASLGWCLGQRRWPLDEQFYRRPAIRRDSHLQWEFIKRHFNAPSEPETPLSPWYWNSQTGTSCIESNHCAVIGAFHCFLNLWLRWQPYFIWTYWIWALNVEEVWQCWALFQKRSVSWKWVWTSPVCHNPHNSLLTLWQNRSSVALDHQSFATAFLTEELRRMWTTFVPVHDEWGIFWGLCLLSGNEPCSIYMFSI